MSKSSRPRSSKDRTASLRLFLQATVFYGSLVALAVWGPLSDAIAFGPVAFLIPFLLAGLMAFVMSKFQR